ncbi:MAG: hypothetical protein RID23_08005 [Roseovarius sp.]
MNFLSSVATTLLATFLVATSALATPFDGKWASSEGECTAAYAEGRLAISGDRIQFVESVCTLTQPTGVRDMPEARLFDMQCSGEGMTWSERTFIGKNGENGLLIYNRGFASTYIRC